MESKLRCAGGTLRLPQTPQPSTRATKLRRVSSSPFIHSATALRSVASHACRDSRNATSQERQAPGVVVVVVRVGVVGGVGEVGGGYGWQRLRGVGRVL